MIEVGKVSNRPAVISYMSVKFEPMDKADAELAKVTFTDEKGGNVFLSLKDAPKKVDDGR